MPSQWRRCGRCPRRGGGRTARRRGASRPRLPGRLQLALWTLPSALRAPSLTDAKSEGKTPLTRGFSLSCSKEGGNSRPLAKVLPVPEATPAERPGMPAGRAIEHRAASAIGTAVPAGAAAAGDADGVGRYGLVERRHRHGLRCGDRGKAEADGERRCSKDLHGLSFPVAVQRNDDSELRKHGDNRTADCLTSDDGASDGGASDGGAIPNDAGASADASGGPSGPVRA